MYFDNRLAICTGLLNRAAGDLVEVAFGINAEGRALEGVARPLSAAAADGTG